MLRLGTLLAVATAALNFSVATTFACEGTNVVFEDDFADDAGGWAIHQDVGVKDGNFVFNLPPDAMQADLNITYTVKDGVDICSEAVWPEGDPVILGAGLLFWGEDNKNYFQFGVLNNGKFWIARRQEGKWHTIVENVASEAIKEKPGETNMLRVKADDETAAFFINGTKVRDLRGQAPKGGWRFGLSGDNFDKDKDARVLFRSVKVTD
ncbi:MAG: hypothetical protein WBD76_05870 [Methyloceanibacter sp.]|jgi:hypothetical protein